MEGILRPIPYGTGVFIRKIFIRFFGKIENVRDCAFITYLDKLDIHPTSLIGRCPDINACRYLEIGQYVGMGSICNYKNK